MDGRRIFDRRAFERWLFGEHPLPDGAQLLSNHGGKCPLAWFLGRTHRVQNANVKEKSATWYRGLAYYERRLPRWARVYIQIVDARHDFREPLTLEGARAAYRETLLALQEAA